MRPFFIAAIALVCLAFAGCQSNIPVNIPGLTSSGPSDEEQIAAVLNDVHRGMETKRIYKVLAHVSQNYLDEQGRNYADIREYLQGIMRDYREIRITRGRPRILVYQDRARAVEAFGTIAEPHDPVNGLPVNLQGHVSVYLERIGGAWKIVEWGRIL